MHKVCKYHHDSRQKRKNAPILFPHLWILYGRPFETIFRPGKTTCSIEGRWMEVMNWMIWLKGVRYEFVYTSSGIQCYKYWSNGVKEGCWILTCLLYLIPPEHHSVFQEDEIPSCSDRSKSSLRLGTWKDLCDWSVFDTQSCIGPLIKWESLAMFTNPFLTEICNCLTEGRSRDTECLVYNQKLDGIAVIQIQG